MSTSGWYQLPKGSLGANYLKYQGIVDGVPRVEVHLEWQMTRHTEPQLEGSSTAYITKIQGDPCIYQQAHDAPQSPAWTSTPLTPSPLSA